MEGQKRPSPMGFGSMYFRSGKRFDRASLIDSFKQIKDRGVRYEDVFPGSYDPAARVEGDHRGRDRRRGDLQRRGDGLERDQALPGQGAQPRLLQGLQRLDRGVPGLRPRALRLQCHACPPRASRTASTSSSGSPTSACARPSSSRTRAAPSSSPRPRTTASGPPRSNSVCRSTSTPSSSSRPGTWVRRSRPRVSPSSGSEPRTSASTSRRAASRSSWPR